MGRCKLVCIMHNACHGLDICFSSWYLFYEVRQRVMGCFLCNKSDFCFLVHSAQRVAAVDTTIQSGLILPKGQENELAHAQSCTVHICIDDVLISLNLVC